MNAGTLQVTAADLRYIANGPAPLAPILVDPINRHAAAHGITTPLLMAHFLCHMVHETGGFTLLAESMNYSVDGLLKTFGRHRISEADARRLGRKPGERALPVERQKAIANLLYGGAWGRKNLGNAEPDDGWLFRGSGPYQLTGRSNYRRFGAAAGVDLVGSPERARNPDTGVEVAAKYFQQRMMAAALADDIAGATKALNGGQLGLAEREAALDRAKWILRDRAPAAASRPVNTKPLAKSRTLAGAGTAGLGLMGTGFSAIQSGIGTAQQVRDTAGDAQELIAGIPAAWLLWGAIIVGVIGIAIVVYAGSMTPARCDGGGDDRGHRLEGDSCHVRTRLVGAGGRCGNLAGIQRNRGQRLRAGAGRCAKSQ